MISEAIIEKEKKLEDLLRKESHISSWDKVKNFGSNIRDNSGIVTLIGLSLAGAAFVAYCGYKLYQHSQTTAPLSDVYPYLEGLKTTLETAVMNSEIDMTIGENVLEPVRVAAEQTVQNYNVPETQEILSLVNQSKSVFQSDNLGLMSRAVEGLCEKVNSVANGGKELFGVGTVLGGMIDLILWVASALAYSDHYDGFRWDDNRNLRNKRDLKTWLEEDWPGQRDRLRENPNVEQIYDFVGAVQNVGIDSSKLIDMLTYVKDRSDPKYRLVLEAITLHPEKYTGGYGAIVEAFQKYDRELEREKLEKQLAEEKAKKGILTSSLYKPIKYSELYLDLLSKGWIGGVISLRIADIEGVGEDNRGFFFDRLKDSTDQELFSSVLSFYRETGLDKEKRLAIAKYLFQKGNRQLVKQLASCQISNPRILQYLEKIDELPNVGVKGQVKTIVKLNNTLKQVRGPSSNKLGGLVGLLDYKRPLFDESALEVAQFLSRHQNLSAEQVLGTLSEYFFLTKGKRFKSKWMKKEKNKLGEQELVDLKGVLDKKGERKFLEELKRKVELARFEAFNREIDELCYAPLFEVLGERIDTKGIEITSELSNVVLGYHGIKKSKDELRPLLRNLLKAYFKGEAHQYLDNLEGNRKLEERVEPGVLSAFKIGYSQSYEVGIGKDRKKELQEQAEREQKEFMRFAEALGYKPKPGKQKDPVKEVEEIFKEISKYKTARERKDFLVEAKHHLSNMKQKLGIVKSGSRKVRFYDSKDPIESMQMGIISGSCTSLKDFNGFASVVNTVDRNKKVVYMADEAGTKIGRTLVILTDDGLVTYKKYDHSNLRTDSVWVDYFQTYAREIGLPLIVPKCYAEDGLKKVLKSRGAKRKTIKTRMQKAACSKWYDDMSYATGNGDSSPEIKDKGYKMKIDGYVLE